MNPDSVEARVNIAKVFQRQGKTTQAVSLLEQIVKVAPSNSELLVTLANVYMHTGKCLKAESQLEKAFQIINSMRVLIKLAQCKISLGKYTEARSLLERDSLIVDKAIDSELWRANYLRALCFFHTSKYLQINLDDYQSCNLELSELIQNADGKIWRDSVKLRLVLNVIKAEHYQNSYILEQFRDRLKNHAETTNIVSFCEGAICMMRKKYAEGLMHLTKVQIERMADIQTPLKKVYHLYRAYGFMCEQDVERALAEIQLQKKLNYPLMEHHAKAMNYNASICEGIRDYNHGDIESAKRHFSRATNYCSQKAEPYLLLAVLSANEFAASRSFEPKNLLCQNIEKCLSLNRNSNSNFSAWAHYVNALILSDNAEWSEALRESDTAIEQCEDSYAQFYYLKGIILANLGSFREAIGQASSALAVDPEFAPAYILRSKCNQIQTDSDEAFCDLKAYLTIRENDQSIHGLAGHLLFESGNFHDALLAYEQALIHHDNDSQVWLTKGKTHFLIGEFQQSLKCFQMARTLQANCNGFQYDMQIIGLLDQFVQSHRIDEKSSINSLLVTLKGLLTKLVKPGNIFRETDLLALRGVLQFYSEDYYGAHESFKQAIKVKMVATVNAEEDDEEAQSALFMLHMNYNVAVCLILMGRTDKAIDYLKKRPESQRCHFSEGLTELADLIAMHKDSQPVQKKAQKQLINIEPFSQNNKFSGLLESITVPLSSSADIRLKLCVPYPKVEPPQITPAFEHWLFRDLKITEIQRRPEAPWIFKENETVKFTEEVKKFSRLDINSSQFTDRSQEREQPEPVRTKQLLSLDATVERKLKRILENRSRK